MDTNPNKRRNIPFIRRLFATPIAGLIAGIIAVSNTITYGVLIFSGSLSLHLSTGIGMALFSGLVLATVIALLSSAPGMIASPQAVIASISALLAAQIVGDMPRASTPGETFITVVAAITFSAFSTGIIFITLGRLKLGKAFRFMPYPVFGGFLAGLGWLLVKGGLSIMVKSPLTMKHFQQWMQADVLIRWLPGVVFAVILLVIQRRSKSSAVIPAVLFLGVGAFYLVVKAANIPLAEITEQGWLLGPFPSGALWAPLDLTILSKANWAVIFRQAFTLITLTFTSLVSILFNCSGIELATKHDVDLDRELQAAGIANVLSSFGGGLVGYPTTSLSILPYQLGSRSRLAGLFTAALFGVALFYGATVLSFLPKLVIGGLLVYFGLSFLFRWVIEAWTLLPKSDYFVVILILIVISTVGFLEGVLVGLFATAILFAIKYSQIDIIRNTLTGLNYQSNVDRAPHHNQYLRQKGEQLYIIKLQGFIFFGTAFNLMNTVRQRARSSDLLPLRFVVLDFRLVNGVDTSALNSFTRMRHLAEMSNFYLLFAHLSPKIEHQLISEGILIENEEIVRSFPDIDHAVEWCENRFLFNEGITMIMPPSLKSLFKREFPASIDIDEFMKYLRQQTVEANTPLIHRGDSPNGIYFIERGQVTVQLELDGEETIRLRTMGAGTIVGELGVYLGDPASATVVTEIRSSVYLLSLDALKEMEETDPKIAAGFHQYLATAISKRLVDTNATVQALLD